MATLISASINDALAPRTAALDHETPAATPQRGTRRTAGRQLWLALVIATAVILPRSLLMARAHSESYDDRYHLIRGLAFLTRSVGRLDLWMNDPPLGEGLVAAPMLAANLLEGRAPLDDGIYDHPMRAERLRIGFALWNTLLFLPLIGVIFAWCRQVYGIRSAWLATALIAIDPTFAALVPVPSVDLLGVTGIVVACYLAWRYFEQPTASRLVAASAGAVVALMLKHTAIILPMVMLTMAALAWGLRPWLERQELAAWKADLPGRVRALAMMGFVGTLLLWPLTLFDLSAPYSPTATMRPTDQDAKPAAPARPPGRLERRLGLTRPWPAGVYFRALRSGLGHGMAGHEGYLYGEKRVTGWWYYFPVIATYKVPLGIAAVLVLGLLSFRVTPPRWAEWGLFIPLLAWTLFLMKSKINIGFRHFLPAYVFSLAMAARCLAGSRRIWSVAAWSAVAVAAIHVATYHPDYLAYINAPRHKPYLAISDSNIDWGQSLKQVRDWLDAHPARGRQVRFYYFGEDRGAIRYYLGDRAVLHKGEDVPPTDGLLLISAVHEAGPYERPDLYETLWPLTPDAVIGHCILVYDLDRLGGGKPFRWVSAHSKSTPGDKARAAGRSLDLTAAQGEPL